MKPQYILVAGVNGAGKSTLYRSFPHLFENTRRLNADEKLQASGGDWRNPADAARAMRDTIKDLRHAIASGESIHQETTLAGSAKSFQNLIDRAHAQGYEVTMLYVSLDSADKAVDRVESRVTKGGHGVDEADIRRRYESSLRTLEERVEVLNPQSEVSSSNKGVWGEKSTSGFLTPYLFNVLDSTQDGALLIWNKALIPP